MKKRLGVLLVQVTALLLVVSAVGSAQSTLQRVRERGRLVCGVNNALLGFGYVDSAGNWSGFDIDFCRAVAAAVLGDANAVEFVPLSAAARQPALQTGEVDVLIRNTTVTLTRETDWTANFVQPIFYDGQGFMTRKEYGIETLHDLAGATICVTKGTTTELNLADTFRALGIPFTPIVQEDANTVYSTYEQGRCDAVTSDKSQLAGMRALFANPDEHVILEPTISKEPLAPAVRHGDDQWYDIVSWVVDAVFFAEEVGVTSQNIDTFTSEDPEVQRFLGITGDFGEKLGLDNQWVYRIIKQVGNYGEIYERNISPLGIPRGLNAQWRDGGLIYARPFR
ncbi:MAG: amino acid ABC transporter substrate-binding protein [Limnochordales bacterium]